MKRYAWVLALLAGLTGQLSFAVNPAFGSSVSASASPTGLDFTVSCAGPTCNIVSGASGLVYIDVSYKVSDPKITDPALNCTLTKIWTLSGVDLRSGPAPTGSMSCARKPGQPPTTEVTATLRAQISQGELLALLPEKIDSLYSGLGGANTVNHSRALTLAFQAGVKVGGTLRPAFDFSIDHFEIFVTRKGPWSTYALPSVPTVSPHLAVSTAASAQLAAASSGAAQQATIKMKDSFNTECALKRNVIGSLRTNYDNTEHDLVPMLRGTADTIESQKVKLALSKTPIHDSVDALLSDGTSPLDLIKARADAYTSARQKFVQGVKDYMNAGCPSVGF